MLPLNRAIRSTLTMLLGSNNSSSNSRQPHKPDPIMVAVDFKAGDEAASLLLLEGSLLLLLLLVLRDKVVDDRMRSRGRCKLRRRSVVLCRV